MITIDIPVQSVEGNDPTKVRSGVGRFAGLADACTSQGIYRPLLGADPELAGLPMLQSAVAANSGAGR